MIDRLFLAHPRSVDESFPQHWLIANRFGWQMIAAGLGCVIHGFIPALFTRTGNNVVKKLYAEMKNRQPALRNQPAAFNDQHWVIDYEI